MDACVWLSRERATVFAQPNNVGRIPDDGQYDLYIWLVYAWTEDDHLAYYG